MKHFLVALITQLVCIHSLADVRLARIFGDNMVLQRTKPIPVWGWAAPGEEVTVQFNKQLRKTKAGKNGKWQVVLGAEAAGGPYQLLVRGRSRITLNNVLVGEVWICSGQSNMEMMVKSSLQADREIREGDFPQIRHVKLPNKIAGQPAEDLDAAEWQVGSPATVGNFTAVGYFFARKIYQELKVPVGLINASWGGTMIETWTSREALEQTEAFEKSFNISFNAIEEMHEKQSQGLLQEIESVHGPLEPVPAEEEFRSLSLDDSRWKKMKLPANFEENSLGKFDGKIWFRKTVRLDKTAAGKPATLNLSTIDDMDETFINGVLVGSSNAYDIVRQYKVPAGILKEGDNVVAVRVTDNNGNGGFFGKPDELNLACENQMVPLSGDWSYKLEALNKTAVNPNSYPSLLFNAMIHPLVPFAIRGVLWYQGETNAGRAYQYKTAFPLLINDWRARFKQGDFPFYFVQLASFNADNGNSANGSAWAELREAQAKTLQLPSTGMAVALDIGETNDIHPRNKQDVGVRLAAIALKYSYDKDVAASGPVYQSMKTEAGKAILSFSHVDSGFLVKDRYGYIKGFEIAGPDKKFHFAKSYIENDKVIVYSDAVPSPVAVRYGWADDMPEANLYNRQGLPAVPFRTDTWPGVTDKIRFEVTTARN